MAANDTVTDIIKTIVLREFKYWMPQRGQVKNINDPEGLGRVKVTVPILGWTTEDLGVWAKPAGQSGLITPKQDDWVLVQFIAGNPADAVWVGTLPVMKGSEPSIYQDQNTQILFEDPDEQIGVNFRQDENVMEIGKEDFREAARVDDTTISSSDEDSAFWGAINAFFGVITGTPVPEPGSGSPSALQAALAAALAGAGGAPTEMAGKIDSGSTQVKIGDKPDE